MKIALLADIHANYPALVEVLRDAQKAKAKAVWVLGDVFGRGPLPVSCINLLDQWKTPVWLTGNHDRATLSTYDGNENTISNLVKGQEEIAVVRWHAAQLHFGLRKSRIDLLREAPTWMEAYERVYASHGAIISADPMDSKNIGLQAYAHPYRAPASAMLKLFRDDIRPTKLPRLFIFGHTHVRALASPPDWDVLDPGSLNWVYGPSIELDGEHEITFDEADKAPRLICPGSVGNVRERNSLDVADYALLEIKSESYAIEFRRVKYNLGEFVAAMALVAPDIRDSGTQLELKQDWFAIAQKLIQQVQQDLSDEHRRQA